MKKFLKKYLLWICLAAAMLGVILFIFFPRKVSRLAVSDHAAVTQVTIYFHADDTGEDVSVVLTVEQSATLLALLEENRCFLRPFGKGYNNGGEEALNCSVLLRYAAPADEVTPLLYISTNRCMLVNGARYAFYGSDITDYIRTLRP